MRLFYFGVLLLFCFCWLITFFRILINSQSLQSNKTILKCPKQTNKQLTDQLEGPSKQKWPRCLRRRSNKTATWLSSSLTSSWPSSILNLPQVPQESTVPVKCPCPLTRILLTCNTETISRADSSKFLKCVEQYICFPLFCWPRTTKQRYKNPVPIGKSCWEVRVLTLNSWLDVELWAFREEDTHSPFCLTFDKWVSFTAFLQPLLPHIPWAYWPLRKLSILIPDG